MEIEIFCVICVLLPATQAYFQFVHRMTGSQYMRDKYLRNMMLVVWVAWVCGFGFFHCMYPMGMQDVYEIKNLVKDNRQPFVCVVVLFLVTWLIHCKTVENFLKRHVFVESRFADKKTVIAYYEVFQMFVRSILVVECMNVSGLMGTDANHNMAKRSLIRTQIVCVMVVLCGRAFFVVMNPFTVLQQSQCLGFNTIGRPITGLVQAISFLSMYVLIWKEKQ